MKKTDEFDFHNGKQVSKKQIQEWHNIILEDFKKGIACNMRVIRSGNGFVIGCRNEKGITIFEVDKGYKYFAYEKQETKELLETAYEYCIDEDKSEAFMLEYVQDVAGVDLDCVLKFIEDKFQSKLQ